ncbi:MAG: J domain-containing protein [Terracidiphilus sp.]|jgi:hypothetical protein
MLGLQPTATDKEIRAAYHVLVKVWHPDRFQHDPTLIAQADEKLKGINSAFQYLISDAGREQHRTGPASGHDSGPHWSRRTKPSRDSASRGDSSQDEPVPDEPAAQAPAKMPRSVRILRAIFVSSVFRACALVAVIAFIGWIMFKPIDRFLSSEPLTAATYADAKNGMQRGIWGIKAMVSGYANETRQNFESRNGPPAAAAEPAPQEEPSEPAVPRLVTSEPVVQKPLKREYTTAPASVVRVLPYVTAGLSKDEVIAAQGQPTSNAENRLFYGRSELDFSGDRLVGWKIDPASPIRVKLWPDAPVDPDLDSFWVGSSKNEVIVVQGTPTFWSQDTFGYGGSEVYFKDGRVVSWKNDPTTVPLHAMRR